MSKNNRILEPNAREGLNQLKQQIINEKGLEKDGENSNDKFEIANELGIPLTKGDNGGITARQAGKIGGPIGGPIGGNMVKEMIKLAQEQLMREKR